MAKRGRGEGSAPRRTDTGWVGHVWVTYQDGARRRLTRRAPTREGVLRKYREAVEEAAGGVASSGRSETVEHYASRWLARRAAEGMKPSALTSAESALRLYVLPSIGTVRLDALRPQHVERMLTHGPVASLSPRSRLKAYRVLSSVLEAATRDGLLASNPVRRVMAPSVAQHAPATMALDPSDVVRVLDEARARGMEVRATLALLGLRQGEALALSWADVDLERHRLTVRASRTRAAWRHGTRCTTRASHTPHACPVREPLPLLQAPKSRASRRVIPLPQGAVDVLRREHKRTHPREPGHPELPDPVITRADGVSPASIATDAVAWRHLLDAVGLSDADLHSLRHTAATSMLRSGADLATVGGILGHASMASTSAYLHSAEAPARIALGGLLDGLVGTEADRARAEAQRAAAFEAFKVADPEPSWGDEDAHAAWRQRVVAAGFDEPPEPF